MNKARTDVAQQPIGNASGVGLLAARCVNVH
jgi:hypothetical protein